jgi:hypothetical protein
MDLIHDEHILQGIVSYKTQVKEIKEAEYEKRYERAIKSLWHHPNSHIFRLYMASMQPRLFPNNYMHLSDEGFLNWELDSLLGVLIAENRIDLAIKKLRFIFTEISKIIYLSP